MYWSGDNFSSGGLGFSVPEGTTIACDGGCPTRYLSELHGTGSGDFSYAIPVDPGDHGPYTVVLHMAEIYHTTTGKRVFNVNMEGVQVLSNLDLVADIGAPFTAKTYTIRPTVTDGTLNIDFISVTDYAKVRQPSFQDSVLFQL